MSSILESLLGQLQGPALSRMASDVGADEGQVRTAATAAIPLLLGALARNASSEDGAKALHGALQKDHDGSLLDNVQAFLGGSGGRAANGAGILGHLLGARTPGAAQAVGKTSGLDPAQAGRLLTMLAPLVMAAVGRAQRTGALDPASLGRSLSTERDQAVEKAPGAGGLLLSLLDRDGDGSVLDEAGDLLKGFLRRR
jgi:hypothetical protein